jgi:hypothetical protein
MSGARADLEPTFDVPESGMTIAMIAVLVGLSAYLGLRLHAEITKNSSLRANVAQLKRRLDQR